MFGTPGPRRLITSNSQCVRRRGGGGSTVIVEKGLAAVVVCSSSKIRFRSLARLWRRRPGTGSSLFSPETGEGYSLLLFLSVMTVM